MKQKAIIVTCPGVESDGLAGHMMRDFCSSCAPFWEKFPICPIHRKKLTTSYWCKRCRTHYKP